MGDPGFQKELNQLLHDYVGRPTPLYYANRLSQKYGAKIYLKREDLCHTGAHKLNNALGQILLAKRLGKPYCGRDWCRTAWSGHCHRLRADEHGCVVYMGATDVERQFLNVQRMRMLVPRSYQ